MKIHAPNIVLERYAEIVNMQKPIKVTIDITISRLQRQNYAAIHLHFIRGWWWDGGEEEELVSRVLGPNNYEATIWVQPQPHSPGSRLLLCRDIVWKWWQVWYCINSWHFLVSHYLIQGTSWRIGRSISQAHKDLRLSGRFCWELLMMTPGQTRQGNSWLSSSYPPSTCRLGWWDSLTRMWSRPASRFTREGMISTAPRGRRVTEGWGYCSKVCCYFEHFYVVAIHGVGSLEELLQSPAPLAGKEILWWQGMNLTGSEWWPKTIFSRLVSISHGLDSTTRC